MISQPLSLATRQQGSPTAADHVSQSRVRARRWWVIRSTVLLTVSALLLCAFVLWRRDRATINDALRNSQVPVSALQSRIDELGWLPSTLPNVPGVKLLQSYADSADRFFAVKSGGPAIIAAAAPVPLILRSDGRCVVVYDHGRVYAEWLSEADFRTRLLEQAERTAAFERERQSRPPELP